MSALRTLLLRLLRVPPEPQPPSGASDSLRVFRAAPAYYRYNRMKWAVAQVSAVIGLIVTFFLLNLDLGRLDNFDLPGRLEIIAIPNFDFLARLEIIAIPFLIVQAIVSLALLRLRYELRWYIVSDRALRIRHGLYSIREQTMTIANIQNLAIRQGPVQKLFGIANLEVRTAGGGSTQQNEARLQDPHLGSLEGIDNAAEVREIILKALRQHRDAGLGDPDEAASPPSEPSVESVEKKSGVLVAAAELLEQARLLRAEIAPRES